MLFIQQPSHSHRQSINPKKTTNRVISFAPIKLYIRVVWLNPTVWYYTAGVCSVECVEYGTTSS